MNVLDLFSGIGGFSLGLERAGMTTVAFCERELYPRQVLSNHWPYVPIYHDVKELTYATLRKDKIPPVDVICGGFPCQDISTAGKGAGLSGARSGLWFEFARLIGEVGPTWVIVENVRALLGRGLVTVLQDLCSLGFDAEWHCIPASVLGAHHQRDRVWIVAHARNRRIQEPRGRDEASGAFVLAGRIQWHGEQNNQEKTTNDLGYSDNTGRKEQRGGFTDEEELLTSQRSGGRTAESRLGRGFNGISSWLDGSWETDVPRTSNIIQHRSHRIKCLGNAVVPQIPELIGKAIMDNVYLWT